MEPENFGTEKKKNSYYCYLDESRTVPRTASVKQDAGSGRKWGHQLIELWKINSKFIWNKIQVK